MNSHTFADDLQKSLTGTQPPTHTSERIKAAREVLLQGLEFLFGLEDGAYSKTVSESSMSIGDHYGQAIQRFRSLLQGYRSREIRYSTGESDCRLRSEVVYAIIATCDVLRALKRYLPPSLARKCPVVPDQPENREQLPDFASTLSELACCTANAIEQYAAIRKICEQLESMPLRDFRRAKSDGLPASNSEPQFWSYPSCS